jgi:hypothetical protein
MSTIYQAVHTKTQLPVAVKQLHLGPIGSTSDRDLFESEANIMNSVNHPFIIKFFDVMKLNGNVIIVMEYASNGNLLEFLNRRKPHLSEMLRIFTQLVSALYYLHHVVNWVHRDLKLENILLDEHYNVKLVDFDLSKRLGNSDTKTTTVCGSLPYCAPEVFQNKPYGRAVDIWSLGICLYGMVIGRLPFEHAIPKTVIDGICHHEPEIPGDTPTMITDLLRRMLKKNQDERMTIEEVSQHPWIRTSVWAIYFQRGFMEWAMVGKDDHEIAEALKKIGFDRGYCGDGVQDGITPQILTRRKQAYLAANPELFLSGGSGHGKFGTELDLPTHDFPSAPRKGSVLENMQHHTGVSLAKREAGRITMRPPHRVSPLYLSAGMSKPGRLPLIPSSFSVDGGDDSGWS